MMTSTKRVGHLATYKENRRDSGNYSESCHSELCEEQKRSIREAEAESHENKRKPLERIVSNGHIITTNDCGDDATSTDKDDRFKRQSKLDAKSDELKRLLSISETEEPLKESSLPRDFIASNDAKSKSGHTFDRPFKYKCSKTLDPLLYENEGSDQALLQNHTEVDVINRCDDLINQLQDVTQKYFKLERCYQKVKKICYLMIVVNAVLLVLCITTVVPLLVVLSRTSNEGSQDRDGGNGYALAGENQYQICFACSDMKRGTSFSLETLLDVMEKDETCCFKSITSVVTSLLRNFGNSLADTTEKVKHKLSELNKRILQIEVGLAPDTSKVIGNILQIMTPKEKTAVHLLSERDVPVSQSNDAFNKFIKLRWSSSEGSTILRGNVQLSDDKLNVRVNSEAYYFFYARISFMHKERDTYRRKTPLRYLVYRKRGSISSYLHEAKLNCVFNEISQEHSVTTELILHLNRNDSIFVSVDDADKQLLATKTGAHSMGLFEI